LSTKNANDLAKTFDGKAVISAGVGAMPRLLSHDIIVSTGEKELINTKGLQSLYLCNK